MKLKVNTVFSLSKKGKQFLTVEVVEGETPKVDEVLEVSLPQPRVKCQAEIEADEAYERATQKYGG